MAKQLAFNRFYLLPPLINKYQLAARSYSYARSRCRAIRLTWRHFLWNMKIFHLENSRHCLVVSIQVNICMPLQYVSGDADGGGAALYIVTDKLCSEKMCHKQWNEIQLTNSLVRFTFSSLEFGIENDLIILYLVGGILRNNCVV